MSPRAEVTRGDRTADCTARLFCNLLGSGFFPIQTRKIYVEIHLIKIQLGSGMPIGARILIKAQVRLPEYGAVVRGVLVGICCNGSFG